MGEIGTFCAYYYETSGTVKVRVYLIPKQLFV